MNALLRPPSVIVQPLGLGDLDELLPIERAGYPVPWSRGNFVDAIAAAYPAETLRTAKGELAGYWLALPGVDEMHLLNLTVAPAWQGRGLARLMLERLVQQCRVAGLWALWLEVRETNARAQTLYQRFGFRAVGRRPGYYPAPPGGQREDAVLMSLEVSA